MARRWSIAVLVVLAVSLAINFFLGGFVVRGGGRMDDGRFARAAAIAGLGRAPAALRHRVEATLAKHHDDIHKAIEAVRVARRNVRDSMRAEPFDRAKLDGAFAALRTQVDKMQEVIHAAVGDAIAASPGAERAQIKPPRRGD